MFGISLGVFIQEDPKSDRPCKVCQTTEEGKRWVLMSQVGGETDLEAYEYALCEDCYKQSEWYEEG